MLGFVLPIGRLLSLGVYVEGAWPQLAQDAQLSRDDWTIFLRLNPSLIDSEIRESVIMECKHPLKYFFHSVVLS